MKKIEKKVTKYIYVLIGLAAVAFAIVGWNTGGFNFFTAQKYEFFFQSWISLAGLLFTAVMALTTFVIYRKSKIHSLKYISLSFLLSSFAYLIIGYHSSYCQVCSDLAMCSASHNYSNYFIIIALITSALSIILAHFKNNMTLLKLFSYGLIAASFLMLVTLFISIQFMEIPGLVFYVIETINPQGFIFIFPLILIVLTYIYLKKMYKVSNVVSLIFILLFLSFIPQAYHIFACNECNHLECSEFFTFSGLIMLLVVGLILYSITLQLQEKK